MFQPQLQLVGMPQYDEKLSNASNAIYESILLMGVPKSKVTTGRKRMGHFRMKPDPVSWAVCEKCGEPKRPHRICTKHLDVCGLRKADWEKVKQHEASLAAQAELDSRS